MRRVRVFTIVVIATAMAAQAQEQDWQIDVVATEGTNPEVRLDSQSRPHVASMIEAFDGGGVFHGPKNGAGDWVVDTVSEGRFYAPLDMAIKDDDRIHIANLGHDGWDGRIAIDRRGRRTHCFDRSVSIRLCIRCRVGGTKQR